IRPQEEEPAFRRLAQQCDWSLVIAPESHHILEERCRWVREAGGRLLGPSVEAVSLTADKLALGRHWREQGVLTPDTVLLANEESPPPSLQPSARHPVVLKPRYGAGAQATFVSRTPAELERAVAQARVETPGTDLLLQPLACGTPASLAFIIGPQAAVPLV